MSINNNTGGMIVHSNNTNIVTNNSNTTVVVSTNQLRQLVDSGDLEGVKTYLASHDGSQLERRCDVRIIIHIYSYRNKQLRDIIYITITAVCKTNIGCNYN